MRSGIYLTCLCTVVSLCYPMQSPSGRSPSAENVHFAQAFETDMRHHDFSKPFIGKSASVSSTQDIRSLAKVSGIDMRQDFSEALVCFDRLKCKLHEYATNEGAHDLANAYYALLEMRCDYGIYWPAAVLDFFETELNDLQQEFLERVAQDFYDDACDLSSYCYYSRLQDHFGATLSGLSGRRFGPEVDQLQRIYWLWDWPALTIRIRRALSPNFCMVHSEMQIRADETSATALAQMLTDALPAITTIEKLAIVYELIEHQVFMGGAELSVLRQSLLSVLGSNVSHVY